MNQGEPAVKAQGLRRLAEGYREMAKNSDSLRYRFAFLDLADDAELQAMAWDTQARKERMAWSHSPCSGPPSASIGCR